MSNAELDKILQSGRVPERPAAYWEQFPTRITSRLHRRRHNSASATSSPPRLRWSWPVLAAGLAVACMLFPLLVKIWKAPRTEAAEEQIVQARKYYHEIAALFPNQVRGLVFDKTGAQLVLAEQANLPSAKPLYIKICGKDGCHRFVSFSGQQIQLGSESYDVLIDHQGKVILAGQKTIWSSGQSAGLDGEYRIEARPLEGAS